MTGKPRPITRTTGFRDRDDVSLARDGRARPWGRLILIGMGLSFIFMRPALLPEDARYMRSTVAEIHDLLPQWAPWLRRVFGVMGGFMITTGLLTVHVALTTYRVARPAAALIVALSGLVSIGGMAVTNFVIGSDFKWLLLIFTFPWLTALALFWAGRRHMDQGGRGARGVAPGGPDFSQAVAASEPVLESLEALASLAPLPKQHGPAGPPGAPEGVYRPTSCPDVRYRLPWRSRIEELLGLDR